MDLDGLNGLIGRFKSRILFISLILSIQQFTKSALSIIVHKLNSKISLITLEILSILYIITILVMATSSA